MKLYFYKMYLKYICLAQRHQCRVLTCKWILVESAWDRKPKGPFRKEARLTLAAMAAAVMCEEELSSVEATPLSFFSSSSSSHCTPLSSVCLWGLVVGGGERGGGGEGRSSSSSCTSFTFTMASRKRSMAWGRAGSINWKHSYAEWEEKLRWKVTCTCK